MINNAHVLMADVNASNGVVHLIDEVLLPGSLNLGEPSTDTIVDLGEPGTDTIVDLAVATPDLSTLVAALKAGGLVDTLSGKGPFTVFAPTNEAFARLPKATLDYLLEPEHVKELDRILTYHVASGRVYASQLHDCEEIKTLEGSNVKVRLGHFRGKVYINNAEVLTANVNASNGVVHIINSVLLP
jgi:uncharacterized surface protein with fasciclin (FAS1) repeats